jgi:hypothetical protein
LVFTIEIITIKGGKKPASKCEPSTKEGCDDKEKAFIVKMADKDSAAIDKELTRLKGMAGGKMKPELATWLNKRVKILEKMTAASKTEL